MGHDNENWTPSAALRYYGKAIGWLELPTSGEVVTGYTMQADPSKTQSRWHVAGKKVGEGQGTAADYRSFGYWARYNMQDDSTANYDAKPTNYTAEFWISGTDRVTSLEGVTGTATYEGESAGMVAWHSEGAARRSAFDGASTTLTANFGDMTMDGRVDLAGHVHNPDGCKNNACVIGSYSGAATREGWSQRGPSTLTISDATINQNGTFTGGHWAREGRRGVAAPSEGVLNGQFYGTDGTHPETAMGTFNVRGGMWHVQGVFGADK